MKYNSGSLTIAGKRKTAVAKATIKQGSGKITINKIFYENLQNFHRLAIKEVIDITKKIIGDFKFDISIRVNGGGQESQIQATRLAIAKAIIAMTKSSELRKAFVEYDKNMLIADTRRKEACKPGDSKARSRRQKSFR